VVVVRSDIFQRYPANSTLKDLFSFPLIGCHRSPSIGDYRSKPSYCITFKSS